MPCLVPLPSLSAPSSPLPAWMFGIEKKTFNLLSDSNEITIPVVFMGKTLTCLPGFLGGTTPVVSLSRYKFQAACHCLCGRGILIKQNCKITSLHTPKMSQFVHRYQNCFCFCSRTFPSHVGTFFGLQWEFQWENGQN